MTLEEDPLNPTAHPMQLPPMRYTCVAKCGEEVIERVDAVERSKDAEST